MFPGARSDESYREETRDANGRVQGRYGYVDPNGILRTVEYLADEYGFRYESLFQFQCSTSDPQITLSHNMLKLQSSFIRIEPAPVTIW